MICRCGSRTTQHLIKLDDTLVTAVRNYPKKVGLPEHRVELRLDFAVEAKVLLPVAFYLDDEASVPFQRLCVNFREIVVCLWAFVSEAEGFGGGFDAEVLRRGEALVEPVGLRGDGQEGEDASAVVVQHDDDERVPRVAEEAESVQVVQEGDVADEQRRRSAKPSGESGGGGDDAVDAADATVERYLQWLLRHRRGVQIHVPRGHTVGHEESVIAAGES